MKGERVCVRVLVGFERRQKRVKECGVGYVFVYLYVRVCV